MPWGPGDWDDLSLDESGAAPCEPAVVRALHEVVRCIPEKDAKVVGVLGAPDDSRVAFLEGCFSRVVRMGSPMAVSPRRFDMIVALGGMTTTSRRNVNRSFASIHSALREGGVFIAGFPARSRRDAPFLVRLGAAAEEPDDRPLHEVELQYRLRRAGFQGLRIRRFRADLGHPETVLCMAVRRALN